MTDKPIKNNNKKGHKKPSKPTGPPRPDTPMPSGPVDTPILAPIPVKPVLTPVSTPVSVSTENELVTRVKNLELLMLSRVTCGSCNKSKRDIEKLGLTPYITVKDIDSDEGLTIFGKLPNKPVGSIGLPVFTSLKTKKSYFYGYCPIEIIVDKLE